MKKSLKMMVCLLIFALLLVGCASGGPQTQSPAVSKTDAQNSVSQEAQNSVSQEPVKSVKIGVVAPLSGASASQGEIQVNGVQMYIDRVNSNGGIKSLVGAKVELVIADSESTSDVGVSAFERLVNQSKVCAIMGTLNSNVAAACAPLAIKYQIPFELLNSCSSTILSTPSKYIYRANADDVNLAVSVTNFINWLGEKKGQPITKIAYIYDNGELGVGNLNNMKAQILPNVPNLQLAVSEPFQAGTADFSTIINKVKQSGAELVIPSMYLADSILFTKQMKEYDCNVPIMAYGNGFGDPIYLPNVGKDGNYIIAAGGWFSDVIDNVVRPEEARKVIAELKQKYNKDPNEAFVNGWLGVGVVLDAIERAGSVDKEAIADALDATDMKPDNDALLLHPYKGVKFGDYEDPKEYNQNIYQCYVFAQVINGEWKMIYPTDSIKGDNPLIFPVPNWKDR